MMLKRFFLILFFCLAIFCFAEPSPALNIQDVPNPRQLYGGWVTDIANLLTAETEIKLDRKISRLESNNGSEIAVVTVPETAPSATSKEFATELFNYWGIGKKEINNGVLVSISKSDRRIEIETGYGVRNILIHTFLQKLIDRQIISNFKQNDFDSGVQVAIDNIILALRKSDFLEIKKINSQQKQNYRETRESFLAVVICFSIASIVSLT